MLGEPLLLPGEERAAYDELLATVIATIQPSDVLEQIWAHEATQKGKLCGNGASRLLSLLQTAGGPRRGYRPCVGHHQKYESETAVRISSPLIHVRYTQSGRGRS
jgi:hypothetical protein